MLLSSEQWDEVIGRLNSCSATKCPMCGSEKLAVGQWVFEMRPFAFGAMASEGPILPVIPAECPTCGHVVLFNAVTLGIVPVDEDGEVS